MPEYSDNEVTEIIREKLPRWQAACSQIGADTVILQQMAFGTTQEELFLMALAIRYAGIVGKIVTVIPNRGTQTSNL